MKYAVSVCALLCSLLVLAQAQQRRFEVHNRGLLHQSVYNTGELGRAYDQGTAGIQLGNPSFEWPGNSAIVVDNVQYTGQHNSFGGGVQLAVNRRDTTRMYAFCGGVTQLPVAGVYSFPLSLTRTENFPILPDGSLNPLYDPNEAEEKIVSSWATPVGITITRTSRAWSAPDYDDFIIYEYEMENTGDTDGNPATPARQDTLTELVVGFSHGLAPGKTGHERRYNRWNGTDFQQTDVYARFDRRRWLSYAMSTDGAPDPQYFDLWARTGTNGGGLQAPMSVGFLVLYFDTTRLARRTETLVATTTGGAQDIAWDANNHLKQPYLNRLETSLLSEAKHLNNMVVTTWPRSGNSLYSSNFGNDWQGRTSFNVRQSWRFAVGKQMAFGPYILRPGERIRFAIAEVAGYGPSRRFELPPPDTLKDEGGSCGETCGEAASAAFYPVPNYDTTMVYGADNRVHGSTYLTNYRLPQYVTSKDTVINGDTTKVVVTIREVADRAIQVYTGNSEVIDYDMSQYWPESMPDRGVYRVPIPPVAPIFSVEVDSLPRVKLVWPPSVDSLMLNTLSHYRVERAPSAIANWTPVDTIRMGDPRYFKNGRYEYEDFGTRVGEQWYYSVITFDTEGRNSARTSIILNETQRKSQNSGSSLGPVVMVPNPYVVRSGYEGAGNPDPRVGFYNLPPQCTIRIYTYSGQLVSTFEHTSGLDMAPWYQVTRNEQFIASGLYFFVVTTADGRKADGKFVIIH